MILAASERRWTGFALRRSRARAYHHGTRSTWQAAEARVREPRCARPSAAARLPPAATPLRRRGVRRTGVAAWASLNPRGHTLAHWNPALCSTAKWPVDSPQRVITGIPLLPPIVRFLQEET